jgi:hypothetical protein
VLDLIEGGGIGCKRPGEPFPRTLDINELVSRTKFTKSEIQFIYRDFKTVRSKIGVYRVIGKEKIIGQLFTQSPFLKEKL